MNERTRMPRCACPYCGVGLDGATSMNKRKRAPGVGDLSLCGYCAALLVFDDEMKPRKPRADEWRRLSDIDLMIVRELQAVVESFRRKHEAATKS